MVAVDVAPLVFESERCGSVRGDSWCGGQVVCVIRFAGATGNGGGGECRDHGDCECDSEFQEGSAVAVLLGLLGADQPILGAFMDGRLECCTEDG